MMDKIHHSTLEGESNPFADLVGGMSVVDSRFRGNDGGRRECPPPNQPDCGFFDSPLRG